MTNFVILQHVVVTISALLLYRYGFIHFPIWAILLFSFLFFIIAALMVTAVQVGIFVEGKPLFGVSLLFRLMPFLSGLILLLISFILFF